MSVETGAPQVTEVGRRPPTGLSFELLAAKFGPPPVRPGLVARTRLLERLERVGDGAAPAAPVVCVVAPPGYGKTTLLAQWAWQGGRQVAWISVDRRDNDPMLLLTYLAEAIDRIEPIDRRIFGALASQGASAMTIVPRLAGALASMRRPVVVVLDHLEAVDSPQCLDAVAELALNLPGGSQLVLASRVWPRLPLARLRAQGSVVELGAADLAMDEPEARALLEAAGSRLAGGDLAHLLERTEGWPVGLYLAALADKVRSPAAGAGTPATRAGGLAFTGDDRYMADYLRAELLEHLSPRTVWFLTRTSVLGRMNGPLCDAVLGAKGSEQVLASMEEANLLLVPLDRTRQWYRYHHLFRELLRAELERREPHLAAGLHARAAAWYQANGLPELAIDHAQAAGDTGLVAALVAALARPAYAAGRQATVDAWMLWLEEHAALERYPLVAVAGQGLEPGSGQPAAAERWAGAAARGVADAPAGDRMHAWLALVDAMLCRDGPERMGADARRALRDPGPDAPWPATALLLEGLAGLLTGDLDGADPVLTRSAAVAVDVGALPSASVALAERAVIAIERQRWDLADPFIERALELVTAGSLETYAGSLLVYALGARAALRHGDRAGAEACLTAASRLRPLLTYALPQFAVQSLLEFGRAYLAVGDAAGARMVLRQARDIMQVRPDLGVLGGQADQLRDALQAVGAGTVGASSLTTAELRLLPLLATHLSFREMGDRLFVSRHTVKAQAVSVYRKLGVSSRSEAIDRLHDTGLLGTAPPAG